MRQGLFLKIFTSFWFTVMIAGISLEATASYARRRASMQDRALEGALPAAARTAVQMLERSGPSGLSEFLVHLQRTLPVIVFFLNDSGTDVNGRWVLPAVRKEGLLALREQGIHQGGNYGEIAALRALDARGRPYALIFVAQRSAITWYWASFPQLRLAAIFVLSGVFCCLIARHVTRPLERLQAAASAIAEGRLETRVKPELQRRGDEIAGLARDFNRMAARIEELVAGQKQLLASVSHELRSPLSRLMVALTVVEESPAEEIPEHLERIRAEARRIDKLIGQLLALSYIDSALEGVEPATVDLTAMVQELVSDADYEARARNRRVVTVADAACVTTGSEEALRRAVENVVRNAVRYTADGTDVEISLTREPARAVLRIRDHGPGVPAGMLQNIFLPFRKGDDTTHGSGLGLAIAERAVRAHSGTIRAFNAEGGGLVVEIELPMTVASG